jgi:hypothetical protein
VRLEPLPSDIHGLLVLDYALFEGERARPKETAATAAANATAAAPIQEMASIDETPTAIPPIPAPAAKPSCTNEVFMLSMMPEASGASECKL